MPSEQRESLSFVIPLSAQKLVIIALLWLLGAWRTFWNEYILYLDRNVNSISVRICYNSLTYAGKSCEFYWKL